LGNFDRGCNSLLHLESIKKEMKTKKKEKDLHELLEAKQGVIIIVVINFRVWLRIYKSYVDSL